MKFLRTTNCRSKILFIFHSSLKATLILNFSLISVSSLEIVAGISTFSSASSISQTSTSVVPTEVPSQPLSTVDNFPDTEVLNRNKDDIEKRKQELKHNVNVQTVDNTNKTLPPSIPVVEAQRLKEKYVSVEMSADEIPPPRFKEVKFDKTVGLPRYCGHDGAMCEPVDSRLLPANNKRVKRSNEEDEEQEDEEDEEEEDEPTGKKKENTKKTSKDDCDHTVKIDAFGGNYTLCLYLRHFSEEPIVRNAYDNLNVSIFNNLNVSDDVSINSFNLYSSVGYVIEEPYASASGYIFEKSFYGTVYMKDTVHYLEPYNRKSRDLRIFGDGLKTLLHRKKIEPKKQRGKGKKQSTSPKNKKNTNGKNKAIQRRTCDLTIVADHLFFREVGEGSVERTVLQMLWHVKEANALFQTEDFDEDGSSECIGLTVSEITIFKSEQSNVNLLTGSYSVPEDFLKRFSRYNFDGFCLGVLFTNRIFDELVLGLSWRGNPKPDGVGGICQHRVRIKSDKNAYSFNALFISLKSSQEARIPLRMGVLNLVHELMHSFGAKHDPEQSEKPECTPEDKWVNGRFLMSKYSNDGHKLNHMVLSPCTKDLVRLNLKSDNRVSCLGREEESYCGDGIVQDGEECDCGTIFQCVAERSCCVPPEGHGYKTPCTLQTNVKSCVRR